MADERPVPLKKLKRSFCESKGRFCIVHFDRNKTDSHVTSISNIAFQSIQDTVKLRQTLENPIHRLDDICRNIPQIYDSQYHGIHRWCYKNFTNTAKARSSQTQALSSDSLLPSESIRSTGSRASTATCSGSVLLPSDRCFLCGKGRKVSRRSTEGLTKYVAEIAEVSIRDAAISKRDSKLIGACPNFEPRAREAHYHESCRRSYTRRDDRLHHSLPLHHPDEGPNLFGGAEQRAAYSDAFKHAIIYIDEHVIQRGHVVRMRMVHEQYLQYIQEFYPLFYNANPVRKLKEKIVGRYGDRVQFFQPNYRSELLYSAGVETGEAVAVAFESATSEKKLLEDAAMILRRNIVQAQQASDEMPWPPSATFLEKSGATPPPLLTEFLAHILTGKVDSQVSDHNSHIALSVAEDICAATTRGHWKMPKHLLLAMSLRHLTGSAQIVTLLNRFGHCSSYSQLLELETAMAQRTKSQDDILPQNISVAGNKFTHACWDNFDILEETPSGAGTTHTTHGILIQELKREPIADVLEKTIARAKERSIKHIASELAPCFNPRRVEPTISSVSLDLDMPPTLNDATFSREVAWLRCRALHNSKCTVPDWKGWVSLTASQSSDLIQQSVVGYMQPIPHPITDMQTAALHAYIHGCV